MQVEYENKIFALDEDFISQSKLLTILYEDEKANTSLGETPKIFLNKYPDVLELVLNSFNVKNNRRSERINIISQLYRAKNAKALEHIFVGMNYFGFDKSLFFDKIKEIYIKTSQDKLVDFLRTLKYAIIKYEVVSNPNVPEEFFSGRVKNIGGRDGIEGLIKNPNISRTFILANKKYLTRYKDINHKITQLNENDYIHHAIPVNMSELCLRDDISEAFCDMIATENPDNIDWIRMYSRNNLSEAFYEKYLERFQLGLLIDIPVISLEFIERHIDSIPRDVLSQCEKLTESFIIKNIKYINLYVLSIHNKSLTENFYYYLDVDLNNKIIWPRFDGLEEKRRENPIDELDWTSLSRGSPLLSERFFERYINKVDWRAISANRYLPQSFFERHIDKPLDLQYLAENPTLSDDFFERYITDTDIWKYISYRDNVSEALLERHLEYLDWVLIVRNDTISEDFLTRHADKINFYFIIIKQVSEHFVDRFEQKLGTDFVSDYINRKDNVSESFLEKHIDLINWPLLMMNKNIPLEFFEKHKKRNPHFYEILNYRDDATFEFFLRHVAYFKKKLWRLGHFTANIPIEFLEEHKQMRYRCDFKYLSLSQVEYDFLASLSFFPKLKKYFENSGKKFIK
jgi:hypothetical protein